MAATKQWGLTPPISSALPSERDLELNNQLLDELKRRNNFEAPEETEKRLVFAFLHGLTIR
jgi:poly(A) polymerase